MQVAAKSLREMLKLYWEALELAASHPSSVNSRYVSMRQHASAFVRRQHTAAYGSIRQHTSAYAAAYGHHARMLGQNQAFTLHTSAYVSIR